MVPYQSITSQILFLCFDALYPSQQFFSNVGMISCLPGLNQYLVSCSSTQQRDSTGGESRTSNPSIPSLTLYHSTQVKESNDSRRRDSDLIFDSQ